MASSRSLRATGLLLVLSCVLASSAAQNCPPNGGGDGNTGCGNQGTANTGSYNVGTANFGYCNSGTAGVGVGQMGTGLTGCATTCPPGTLNPTAATPVPGLPCPAGQTFDLYRPPQDGRQPVPGIYCACLTADGLPAGNAFNPLVNNALPSAPAQTAQTAQPAAATPAPTPSAAAPPVAPVTTTTPRPTAAPALAPVTTTTPRPRAAPAPAPARATVPAAAPAAGLTDVDILNFALNLECLEAEFYSWAAFGAGLSDALRGNGPASVGGQKALLSPFIQAVAEEISRDETNHVRFLRAALGAAAAPCPRLDIGPAFAAAANAALNTTLSPAFSPYSSDLTFLHGAFIFEDVGVTAYQGAAPLLQNATILSAAAGILAVEAYHAGTVRTLLAQNASTVVSQYGVNVSTIIGAISDLRDLVDGPQDDDQGIVAPVTAGTGSVTSASLPGTQLTANIVPANNNSLTFARTPTQVVSIVVLGATTGRGGFFPDGLNA